jgi:hypothetical protein
VFGLSAQVDCETLSKTLRAVADVLDGREPRQPSVPPPVRHNCACGLFSATELAALARRYLRHRRERERLLPDLFADPAWDILLDLFAASIERRPVSVSSACVAAAVPPTTALRWIGTGRPPQHAPEARRKRRDGDHPVARIPGATMRSARAAAGLACARKRKCAADPAGLTLTYLSKSGGRGPNPVDRTSTGGGHRPSYSCSNLDHDTTQSSLF